MADIENAIKRGDLDAAKKLMDQDPRLINLEIGWVRQTNGFFDKSLGWKSASNHQRE
jgi:hypothetical protein